MCRRDSPIPTSPSQPFPPPERGFPHFTLSAALRSFRIYPTSTRPRTSNRSSQPPIQAFPDREWHTERVHSRRNSATSAFRRRPASSKPVWSLSCGSCERRISGGAMTCTIWPGYMTQYVYLGGYLDLERLRPIFRDFIVEGFLRTAVLRLPLLESG